jgi:hypothetical protein
MPVSRLGRIPIPNRTAKYAPGGAAHDCGLTAASLGSCSVTEGHHSETTAQMAWVRITSGRALPGSEIYMGGRQ